VAHRVGLHLRDDPGLPALHAKKAAMGLIAMTDLAALKSRLEVLISKPLTGFTDSMEVYLAAEKLRDLCDGDAMLLSVALDAQKKAAEHNPNAAYAVGDMLVAGHGTARDPDEALKYFVRGAEGGNSGSAVRAAKLHYYVTRDFEQAHRFALVANTFPTEADALYLLGLMAYNGSGQSKDLPKAFEFHQKAAELGHPDAMFELYVLLSTGQGVGRDDEAALEWCKRAALVGQHRACFNMGVFYATGRGVAASPMLAMKFYRLAAEGGNGKAAATLAAMILEAKGKEGMSEAMPYVERALELDFDVAELLIGLGVPSSDVDEMIAVARGHIALSAQPPASR
jgi:uncharacterized protein